MPLRNHLIAGGLAAVLVGKCLPSGAQAQSVELECEQVLSTTPPGPRPLPLELVPDSAFLSLLDKGYYDNRWPSGAVIDSVLHADSLTFFTTLAFMITDPLYYIGSQDAAAAAGLFSVSSGPPDLVLWALDVAARDPARVHVLSSLPHQLSPAQELVLMRQACIIAVQVAAMTPSIKDFRRLAGQDGSPFWYYNSVAELRLIRARLSGQRAAEFGRIIEPILRQAETLR